MARKKPDESLPVAVSTQGGLFATLVVLLMGAMQGARAWLLLIKAASTFLLVAGLLKLFTAGIMQAVRWKETKKEASEKKDADGTMEETIQTIRDQARSPETMEKVPS